jgi:hypothetical protein
MLSRTTGSIYLQKNTVLPLHLSTCTYINIYKTYIMYIQLSQASDDHTLLDTETIPCCIKYFFHFLYKHRNIRCCILWWCYTQFLYTFFVCTNSGIFNATVLEEDFCADKLFDLPSVGFYTAG